MNKFAKKMLAISLAAVTVAGTAAVPQTVYATEVTEQGVDIALLLNSAGTLEYYS